MSTVRPLYLPMMYQDAADHGRLILRDGSSASIRLSRKEDYEDVREFYRRLSPESRRMRFFSEAKPGEDVIKTMCDSSNPARVMTLLVWRYSEGAQRIIATGSYIAQDGSTAEFAVAVDDAFHGRGLGGLILERLSALAVSRGFHRFSAFTHVNNAAMLEVFRNSGFEMREQFQDGLVEVMMSVLPDEKSVSHALQRDRLFTKASIRPFFRPHAVAVIGASRKPDSIGHRLLITLLQQGFSGVIYPVNPMASNVSGIKSYPTPEDLPEAVELAIIAVPRDQVSKVIDGCARRGVRAVIVVSTGYAESNEEGARLQRELVDQVRGYGMRLLGPNCLGVINTDPEVRLNASLSSDYPKRGKVALSSQSGALGMALLNLAKRRNIGLSMFISMGNKADVTGNDLLYYWEDDPDTEVILLYLESFGNPRRFGRIAREVSRRKPIVCVKSGRHRASPEEHAVEALFQQTGVIRVQTLEEMYDAAALFGTQSMPAGRRVHVITNSRGAGILCEDACTSNGLDVTAMIDLTANAEPGDYQATLLSSLRDEHSDALIVLFTPIMPVSTTPIIDAACSALSVLRDEGGKAKTLILVMMTEGLAGSVVHHRGFQLPCYQFPEKAAHALAAAARYRAWRDAPPGFIPEYQDMNLSAIRELLARTDIVDTAGMMKADAVVELLGHASITACGALARPERSFNVKVDQHPVFGPVLSLSTSGFNGQFAAGAAHRMVPLTDSDGWSMIESLLGQHGSEARILHETIMRVSFLAEEFDRIAELHFSPVNLYPGDGLCAALNVRIRLNPGLDSETT